MEQEKLYDIFITDGHYDENFLVKATTLKIAKEMALKHSKLKLKVSGRKLTKKTIKEEEMDFLESKHCKRALNKKKIFKI